VRKFASFSFCIFSFSVGFFLFSFRVQTKIRYLCIVQWLLSAVVRVHLQAAFHCAACFLSRLMFLMYPPFFIAVANVANVPFFIVSEKSEKSLFYSIQEIQEIQLNAPFL